MGVAGKMLQKMLQIWAIVYFCRPQKLIQTYPPVFGNFSQDFYSKNCPNYDTYIDLHQVHKHRPQIKNIIPGLNAPSS